MKRTNLILISLVLFGSISYLQAQTINGQVVSKLKDKYECLIGVLIYVDSAATVSDIDGEFSFHSFIKYPTSILFEGYMQARLMIINLPRDYDSLYLGKIELIERTVMTHISTTQYDTIRTNLIKSFKTNNVLNIQQQKADSILKLKYKPICEWTVVLEYAVLDSLISNEMINPFDNEIKFKVDYDINNDLIIVDYIKIKNMN